MTGVKPNCHHLIERPAAALSVVTGNSGRGQRLSGGPTRVGV